MSSIGVWEEGKFIGVVIFAHGGNYQIGAPFGMRAGEVIELVRVALAPHKCEVTRIIKIALAMLRRASPAVRIVISYADPEAGHSGGIYKGGNWIFLGQTPPSVEYRLGDKRLQKRAYTGSNYGKGAMRLPAGAVKVKVAGKLKFALAMQKKDRGLLLSMARPYAEAPTEHVHAPAIQAGEGGSTRPVGSN